MRADEKLTAAVELESVIRGYDKFCLPFLEPPAQHRRNIESQSVSRRFGLDVKKIRERWRAEEGIRL